MIRRRLLSAEENLIDENTLVFNKGNDLRNHGPERLTISNNGGWIYPSVLGQKACWLFPARTVNGVEGTAFATFPDLACTGMRLFNTNVLTLEFMVYVPPSSLSRYLFSYGYDDAYFFFKIRVQQQWVYADINDGNGVDLRTLTLGKNFQPNQWQSIAITLRNVPNTNTCEYSGYCNGVYYETVSMNKKTGNFENAFVYTVGQSPGIALNYGINAGGSAGVKNIRISKTDRYKKKNYTPYVDN